MLVLVKSVNPLNRPACKGWVPSNLSLPKGDTDQLLKQAIKRYYFACLNWQKIRAKLHLDITERRVVPITE